MTSKEDKNYPRYIKSQCDLNFKEIYPLLRAKSEAEKQRIYGLMAVLEKSGMFANVKHLKKEKIGRLDLLIDNDMWVEYFFELHQNILYYYKSSKQVN
jgi:hypothetical protein